MRRDLGPCRAPGCGVTMRAKTGFTDGERAAGYAPHGGRGLCRKHYLRWLRHGSTEALVPRPSRRRGSESRPLDDVLSEYAMIREDCRDIADAAERMGMSFSALDRALYRAREQGHSGALPPAPQMIRAVDRGSRPKYLERRVA